MSSEFVIGGLASVGATLFTNPIEVVKTRIQLQGELAARGTYVEPYKGLFNGLVTVGKNEGWMALQKGLAPALCFQFIINSFRYSFYFPTYTYQCHVIVFIHRLSIYSEAMERRWIHTKTGEVSYGLGLLWGAIGGVIGSYFSSPFFLVRNPAPLCRLAA